MSNLISLHKYWQTLTWKKKLVLTMGLVNFPLVFFWGVVVLVGIFTRVEIPFFIHFISWITTTLTIATALILDEDKAFKKTAKEIWRCWRERHKPAG